MIKKNIRILLLLTTLCCSVALQAENASMNFQGVDIRAVITAVSKSTGKNFIIDPRVNGKVTLVSSSDVEPDVLYDIFLSILKVHGYVAVPDANNNVIKIVPAFQTKTESTFDQSVADNDISLRVIEVHNATATEMIPILRPLVSKEGHLAAHQSSNLIIISDTKKNIEKVSKIIKQMDRENETAVKTISLINASAVDAVKSISNILKNSTKTTGNKSALKIAAEERTNSVLVSGSDADIAKVEFLLEGIDVKNSVRSRSAVIKINYADAKNIADILNKMISGNQKGSNGGNSITSQEVTETKTVNTPSPTAVVANDGAAAANATNLAPTPPSSPEISPPISTTLSTRSTRYERENVQISVDEKANSIIIIGTPNSVESLSRIVRSLDVKRSQVMVEAMVVEVTTDKSKDFGLLQLNAFESALDTTALITDRLHVIGKAITDIKAWSGLMNDLLQNILKAGAKANLVSAPSIMTLENEEAEISVGQEVPFVTGSFTTTTDTAANPFTTIERKNVGLSLKITPQINRDGIIKLKINQEFSNVLPNAQATLGAADLITSKRTVNTTALVQDGQMLVLGGLIDDSVRETENGVAFVSTIPVLGNLFKSKTSSKVKRNLMIFIRPRIIKDSIQGDVLTEGKYNQVRNLQKERDKKGVSLMWKEKQPVINDHFGYDKQNIPKKKVVEEEPVYDPWGED